MVLAANTNSANSATLVPYPANGANLDANAVNPTTAANANQTQVKVVSPPANAKPMSFPAPDDSEYVSTMNSSGQAVETRTFHNDPLIARVERIWKGVDEKTVTIYLKNGRAVKVPSDKVSEIKSLPVQTLYGLAGVKPPQQPAVRDNTTERKEKKPTQ